MKTSEAKPARTFIIRNKKTLEIWVASSGKRSWKLPAHAKSAFSNCERWQLKDPLLLPYLEKTKRESKYLPGKYYYSPVKFDQQDVYEVVEVKPETDRKVMTAAALLEKALPEVVSVELKTEIEEFLKSL